MNVASMPLSCSSRTWSCISAIKRRYHDADAGTKQGRQLKAQRLAAAGWHDREHVAAAEDVAHDLLLPGTEGIEAEALLELCRKDGWSQVGGQRVIHLAKHNIEPLRRGGPNLCVSTKFAGMSIQACLKRPAGERSKRSY